MSEYIRIFVTNKKHTTFLQIGNFNRDNHIFKVLHNYAPWEAIAQLTTSDLQTAHDECINHSLSLNTTINEKRDTLTQLATWENSVVEKISILRELRDEIFDCQEEMGHWEYTKHYISFLINILLDNNDTEMFIGTECGSNVTAKDIKGG